MIRLSEGIEEGGEIAEAIRTKWKAEDQAAPGALGQEGERAQGPAAQQAYAEGLEPLEAFREPDLVEPVPINEAATTPHELKQIQVDLTELRKHLGNHWETAEEVFKNITFFNEWLPRTQWAYRDRAQTYLLFNTLPGNFKKQLVKVDWTRNCAAKNVAKDPRSSSAHGTRRYRKWRRMRMGATSTCGPYSRGA